MYPNVIFSNISLLFARKSKRFYTFHSFFLLPSEASLGGDNFNDVAVSDLEVTGVKIIDDNNSTLFDFEGGLGGTYVTQKLLSKYESDFR